MISTTATIKVHKIKPIHKGDKTHNQDQVIVPVNFNIINTIATIPKKLKSKTDKDGRLLLVCPTCGDVYIKFWSDVETISCRKYCDECGQKLDWSDRND